MTGPDLNGLSPSIQPLAAVAVALGPWRESVVFIGGAVASLLQSHPPFPRVRPTADVDALSTAESYTAVRAVDAGMSSLGFRRDLTHRGHAHRWVAPGEIAFDLVPAGSFLGGTGNRWDQMAIASAEARQLAPGLTIKHVNAPFFLILKWAAYCDRGNESPLSSTDVEDFLALLASRPTPNDEIARLAPDARAYLRGAARTILGHADCEDILHTHLNNANPRGPVVDRVRQVLRSVAL